MSTAAELKPVTSFLKYAQDGKPYLAGSKCGKCGEVFLGSREVCAKCGTRQPVTPPPPAVTQITKPKNVPATAQGKLGHPH